MNWYLQKKTKYPNSFIDGLFRKHYRYLLKCANEILKDNDEAWEALHFVFERIFQGKMDGYHLDISSNGFVIGKLRKTIRNYSIDLWRKRKRAKKRWDSTKEIASLSEELTDKLDDADIIDVDSAYKYILENGSEINKEIFELYFLDGKSHKEIASTLNIKEGTSKKRVHDCSEKMKTWAKQVLLDIELILFYNSLSLDMYY